MKHLLPAVVSAVFLPQILDSKFQLSEMIVFIVLLSIATAVYSYFMFSKWFYILINIFVPTLPFLLLKLKDPMFVFFSYPSDVFVHINNGRGMLTLFSLAGLYLFNSLFLLSVLNIQRYFSKKYQTGMQLILFILIISIFSFYFTSNQYSNFQLDDETVLIQNALENSLISLKTEIANAKIVKGKVMIRNLKPIKSGLNNSLNQIFMLKDSYYSVPWKFYQETYGYYAIDKPGEHLDSYSYSYHQNPDTFFSTIYTCLSNQPKFASDWRIKFYNLRPSTRKQELAVINQGISRCLRELAKIEYQDTYSKDISSHDRVLRIIKAFEIANNVLDAELFKDVD